MLAAVAIVVAACGGGPGPTTAPAGSTSGGGTATQAPGGGTATQPPAGAGGGTVDACSYLTAADIEDVTGLAIKSAAKGPQFSIFASTCGWDLTDDEAMVPPSIALGIITSGGKSSYEQYFAPFYEDFGYEPIEGLGDEAADAGAGSVLVLSGDVLLDLQYLALKENDVEVAAELARKVLANLGR